MRPARSTTALHRSASRFGTIGLAGLAGLLSIAFGIAGLAVDRMWTFPGTGSTAAEIGAFAADYRPELLVASTLNTLAVGLWLVFGVGVWQWLREVTGSASFLLTCFLVGFVSFVTLLLAGFTSLFLLAYRAPEASDPRLLYDLTFSLLAMSGVPTALALGSYAAMAFGTSDRSLPTWTGWVAASGAVAHLGLLASLIVTSGFFSLEGGVIIAIPGTLFAWIVSTSVVMISGDQAPP